MKRLITVVATLTIPLAIAAPSARADEGTAYSRLHWSASIGDGHTSESASVRARSRGTPSSLHWTASIGTGRVALANSDARHKSAKASAEPRITIAGPHWSSGIGTGRAASEATGVVTNRASVALQKRLQKDAEPR